MRHVKQWKKILVLSLTLCMLITAVPASTTMAAQGKWVQSGSSWYYQNKDGSYYQGWLKDGDYWYYLNPSGSSMVSGTVYKIDGKYYLFGASGKMVTGPGWKSITVDNEKCWYYLNSNSSCKMQWVQVDNAWYYIEEAGMLSGTVAYIDSKYYYFEKNGKLSTKNGWVLCHLKYMEDEGWFYLQNGKCKTGWVQDAGKWYYLAPVMLVSLPVYFQQRNATYLFDATGAMMDTAGWHQLLGAWYYTESGGRCVTGWKKISGKWYYFTPSMVAGRTISIDGKSYTFDKNGAWVN